MYLPISSSFPLFLGGMIAMVVHRRINKRAIPNEEKHSSKQKGILIACGLVAGSALMDVLLAIPFSILHSPDALTLVGPDWQSYSVVLAVISTLALAVWIGQRVCGKK
ncbi:MAG: hypothetical protein CK430_07565 [Legionella sp.]|nr:MAG: hypothetical protein CK430_07565 [Legionella sp.]